MFWKSMNRHLKETLVKATCNDMMLLVHGKIYIFTRPLKHFPQKIKNDISRTFFPWVKRKMQLIGMQHPDMERGYLFPLKPFGGDGVWFGDPYLGNAEEDLTKGERGGGF